MIKFIKRNKVFSLLLSFCLVMIVGLTGLNIVKVETGETPSILPPVILPPKEKEEPVVEDFSGVFIDDENSIELSWKYSLHGHHFVKAEIYRDSELVEDVSKKINTQLPIHLYDMKTGNNEFELRVYYDNGMVVTKTTTVFIDYLFDIQMKHQLVDNNLGKGYLISIVYHYNASTPAGVPRVLANTTINGDWSLNYLGKNSKQLREDYLEAESFYFIGFNSETDQEITWNISYVFDSVGVRKNDTFTEKLDNYYTEDININE